METLTIGDNKSGTCDVYVYKPTHDAKAIVQLYHGANEHYERYQEVIDFLLDEDFIVVVHDQLGHGKRNQEKTAIHFDDHNGAEKLLACAKNVRLYAKGINPHLPLFAIAHSMGSIVLRAYMLEEKDLYDAVIFTGSPYVSKMKLWFAKQGMQFVRRFKGKTYVSPFFTKKMDRPFQMMKQKGLIHEKVEWVTSDVQKQTMIKADVCGNKPFTIQAQIDLIKLMKQAHNFKTLKRRASNHLVAMLCGDEDALCNYGESIKKLANTFSKIGFTHVKYRVYANARHELHNELIRPKVMRDMVTMLKQSVTI
ncbi:MAG: alpha/beta fold hydrolase [Bacillota bacterium]